MMGAKMFGLSIWELLVIALVIIFVVGPKRLPEVAKTIGKGYGNFKRTFNEMKESVNLDDNTLRKKNNHSSTADNSYENKVQSYSAQFKSQWEDKFVVDDSQKPVTKSIIEKNAEENSNKG